MGIVLSDPASPRDDHTIEPVRRGMGAAWLAACMAHDMLYAGDVVRAMALLRRASTEDENEARADG